MPDRSKNLSTGIGTPDPPSHLPAAARREWRKVVTACASHPTWLQHADVPILEAWCTWRAIWLEAVKALAADGILVAGRSSADKARGAEVKHPAIAVLRAATTELRFLGKELGFSPDARAKVAIGSLGHVDDGIWDDEVRRLLS